MENKHSHAGHRKRLKERVKQNGLKSLQNHEILEFLLTYSIPRKNTNDIAHNLLNEYKNIASIFDADPKMLTKVEGVGEESALFLTSLPEVFDIYKQTKNANANVYLKDTKTAVSYFRTNYNVNKFEKFYLFCLNSNYKLLKVYEFEGKTDNSINIDLKEFASKITDVNTTAIIIAHTHPGGNPNPSREDYITTKEIIQICHALRVLFCDHFIVSDTKSYSFGSNNLIYDIYNELAYKPEMEKSYRLNQTSKFNYNLDEE